MTVDHNAERIAQGVANLRETAAIMRRYKAASCEASELEWAADTIEALSIAFSEQVPL